MKTVNLSSYEVFILQQALNVFLKEQIQTRKSLDAVQSIRDQLFKKEEEQGRVTGPDVGWDPMWDIYRND